jgi:hypothetical protein
MSATEDSSHDAKSIILAVVPKLTALISIVCSSAIVRKVYKSPKKRKNVYHRILCGLSCFDIISSFVYFFGTWLVPANKVGGFGLVFGASGNDATCSLSGFFTQFAVSSPLYNGTLAWYYLVSIYYNWSDRKIHNIEKYFHIIPIGFALISSSIALGFDMYGNVEWLCWINPDISDDEEPSEAQKYFRIFQWVCLFGPVWVTVAFVTTVMYMLYKKMRENEKKMEKYEFSTEPDTIVISKEDENRASVRVKQRSSLMGNLWEHPSSSKATVNTPLRKSHITQGDGWKNLRNSTQKDNEGWRNLRRSYVKVVAFRPDEIIRNDAATDCHDGSYTAAFCDIEDESKPDCENLLKQSFVPLVASLHEDTKVDVEAQNGLSAAVDAIKKYEAKPNNDNEMSSIAESKNSATAVSTEVKLTMDEELVLTKNSKLISNGDNKHQRRLSLVEALQNIERPDTDYIHGKPSARNVSFREISSKTTPHNIERKGAFRLSEAMQNCSFLSHLSRRSSRNSSISLEKTVSAEKKKKNYNHASKSRQIAIQGMLYVCAFYITWLFPTLQRITELTMSKNFFVLQFFDTFLLPLQGKFVFVSYF